MHAITRTARSAPLEEQLAELALKAREIGNRAFDAERFGAALNAVRLEVEILTQIAALRGEVITATAQMIDVDFTRMTIDWLIADHLPALLAALRALP